MTKDTMDEHRPHEDRDDALAAYALDALDAGDRLELEAHLATCARCRAALEDLRRVATGVGLSIEPVAPPLDFRARVLAQARAASRNVEGVAPGPTPRAEPAAPAAGVSWWLALAASVLVAIAAGAYALHLRTEVQSLRNERADLEARFAVLNAFDAMRVTLQGQPDAPLADGRAVLSRARGLVFTARHLPALQPGRAYQLWIVTATAPVSMGLLNTAADGSTSAMVPIPANLGTPVAVAVTIEPEGGVPAPTGPKVLVGVVAPQ